MSAPVKPPPAPFDAQQLADTLDTMGLLVASLSDRLDAHGRMLEQVLRTATEARAAAFAAEKATDWERNAVSIGSSLERALIPPMARFREADDLLRRSKELTGQTSTLLDTAMRREVQRDVDARRLWQWRLPWLLAGAVLTGVVLALLGIHVAGQSEMTCRLLGGQHTYFTKDAAEACAFRQW